MQHQLTIQITASPVYPSDNFAAMLNDQLVALVIDSNVLGPEDMTIAFIVAKNNTVIEQHTVKQGVYSPPPNFIGQDLNALMSWPIDEHDAGDNTITKSVYVVGAKHPKG